MLSKIKRATERPDLIKPYLKSKFNSFFYETLKKYYLDFTVNNKDNYIVRLDGYDLSVDYTDEGIGQDLSIYGIRETISYREYREQLRSLSRNSDQTIQVVEIGANIGYYALAPAVDIDNVEIFAAEVDEDNTDRLRKNIEINKMAEKFHIDCVALGSENTERQLYKSSHSNLHSLQSKFAKSKPGLQTETTTTKVKRGESWLADYDTNVSDIDVLRMDVEGYEASVLRGFPELLSDTKVLVHMEVHPKLMDEEDIEYIRGQFQDLQIKVAARGSRRLDVETFDDVLAYPWAEFVGIHAPN